MTEVEAINTILSVIGEAPIESLANEVATQISEVALARRTLDEVRRDVAAEGWSWNTDYGVELTPTASDTFPLPTNILRCEFDIHRGRNASYVVRGGRVWDNQLRTFTLPDVDRITITRAIVDLEFDDLPHAAAHYITIRAARIYGARYVNSSVIFSFTSQDEQYARVMMMRGEELVDQNNMLYGDGGANMGYHPATGRMYRSN